MLRPVNGDGELCGVGKLADYKNLYYLSLKTSPSDLRAVCVKKCPKTQDDTIECFGTKRVKATDCQNKNFYNHYGTIRMLKRFCLPNPDDLAANFDDDAFDNIIGSFGLDDV